METRRWTNPGQPQTLQIAVFLLYINAAFGVLFGQVFSVLGLIIVVGQAAAGFGIANERKWAYWLGVGVAGLGLLPYILFLTSEGLGSIFDIGLIINLLFPVALFALLLHPMSRDYQRIWFK